MKKASKLTAIPRKLPGPWRITFDTNPDDCNLHCIMCEEHSEFSQKQRERRKAGIPPRRMDIKLVEKVVQEAVPLGLKEIIPSTMGEPLLYRYFDRIIELCCEHQVKLNLTTNGTFPRRTASEWAELLVPILSDVKISWNGATSESAESIMKNTRFDDVLGNVKEFIRVKNRIQAGSGKRARVTFQLTFMESNLQEIPEILKLAARLGVDRVKGHHLWVNFPEIEHLSLRRDQNSVAQWNRIVEKCQEVVNNNPLPSDKRLLLDNFYLLNHRSGQLPADAACPFLGRETWVSASGRFDPCCSPDEKRRTLGYFGHLTTQTLSSIWNGKDYDELYHGYMEYEVCQQCNMRRPLNI
ncbi:MAG: radical SAM/SPASM domain-containing protein [Promethearchaeota archaeon]|jgi:MoaA/NifB/PqqE/SkfB family radical SAM enzyme